MALILAFDTSGPHCAVAVLRGDAMLCARHVDMARGQAEQLMPLVAEALDAAGVTLADLDAIAVGRGPGNFTGIRLSVAAARGLSLSLGVPAIGVTTLEAVAEAGPRPMLATLDARRGAVYAQRFDAADAGAPELVADAETLDPALPRFGSGPGAAPAPLPIAEAIGRVALRRLDAPAERPAPLYIRPADAAPPRDSAPTLLP